MANVSGMIVAELKRRRAKLEVELTAIDAAMALFQSPSTKSAAPKKAVSGSEAAKRAWATRRANAAKKTAAPAASLTEAAEAAAD